MLESIVLHFCIQLPESGAGTYLDYPPLRIHVRKRLTIQWGLTDAI